MIFDCSYERGHLMNCHSVSTDRRALFVLLMSAFALPMFIGCGSGAGDATPGSAGGRRDAGTRRDTQAASGGTSGGADATSGMGGSLGAGGTIDTNPTGGAGGLATSVSDAGNPRDVFSDLVIDSGREALSAPDVGGGSVDVWVIEPPKDGGVAETNLPIDLAREMNNIVLDVAPETARDGLPDVPMDGLPDVPMDVAPDVAMDVSPDVSVSADLPVDVQLAVDSGGFSTCSSPGWAKQLALSSSATGLSGDKEGNPFVVDTFFNSLSLGGTAGTITSSGDSDALVLRLDPSTGSAVWAVHFGDTQSQAASSVAVDKSGHVGFVGQYQGGMTIGTSNISNLGAWPYGYVGAVQAADGASLWAKSVALSADLGSAPALAGIAANPHFDDFAVCGYASILATDIVTDSQAQAGGGYDIVVAKVKGSDGSVLWGRQFGGTGNQKCTAVAIDDSGNVVISGSYFGQLDFGSGAFSPAGAANVLLPWVAKLSGTDGSVIAAMNAPPASGVAAAGTTATIWAVDTDAAGNVAIAGQFHSAVSNYLTFGTTNLTCAGSADAFVVKFDHSLVSVWAKSWGDAGQEAATGVAFDSHGDLSVVGRFNSTINIGPAGGILTATTQSGTSNADVFFAHLDGASGASTCAVRFGDSGAQEADRVFVARSAIGVNKDVPFVRGTVTSVLDFGTVSVSTTDPSITNSWIARF
jgi:hypothetical protein